MRLPLLALLLPVALMAAEELDALKPAPGLDTLLQGTRPATPDRQASRATTVITVTEPRHRRCCRRDEDRGTKRQDDSRDDKTRDRR